MPLGGSPFSVQLFHLGSYHRYPVRVYAGRGGQRARDPLRSGAVRLRRGEGRPSRCRRMPGFAGFRVHYVFDDGERAAGAADLPRRQLLPRRGPQHPLRHLGARAWRSRPASASPRSSRSSPISGSSARTIRATRCRSARCWTARASPAPTGSTWRRATAPWCAVDASLFFRADIAQVGIAPLTSMYFFGANDRVGVDDDRGEVHDSDGLSIWRATGEALWRPLVNPRELRVSVFADDNPRGFGLLQRGRDYQAYGDLDARFDRRPNLWVEPKGAWGTGSVRLIEIPIQDETHDNIVAFWTPAGAGHRRPRAAGRLQPALVAAAAARDRPDPGAVDPGRAGRRARRRAAGRSAARGDRVRRRRGRPPARTPCRRPWWNATMASARRRSLRANEVTGGFQVAFDVRLGRRRGRAALLSGPGRQGRSRRLGSIAWTTAMTAARPRIARHVRSALRRHHVRRGRRPGLAGRGGAGARLSRGRRPEEPRPPTSWRRRSSPAAPTERPSLAEDEAILAALRVARRLLTEQAAARRRARRAAACWRRATSR